MTATAEYWESRARLFATQSNGLAAVCSYGMPWFYNQVTDLCQRRALLPLLSRHRQGRALDIGCGVGRWSLRLAAQGMQVTGLDLSEFMVGEAQRRVAAQGHESRFLAGSVQTLSLPERFDLILSVTVLQHIVDAAAAAASLRNLAQHLRPGGELILLEAAPTDGSARCNSQIFAARTQLWYQQALRAADLDLVDLRGCDPMPLKRWALPYYRRLPAALSRGLSCIVAGASLPFDWAFGARCPGASWHKVFVARKRALDADES
jgi:2-polyprenyl-3-methyl-5-hydroxy-6-metoxy-1,4-benzoquinol methylase